MTFEMVEGYVPTKGRLRIRRDSPMQDGQPVSRTVGVWISDPKPGSVLEKLQKAYLDALAAVDAMEDHKAEARKSGLLTDAGLNADALKFAAGTLAPKLHRAHQAIAEAQKEGAERRAKLTVPVDKSDTYGFMRRQRKLDLLLRLPEKQRQAVIASDKLDGELALAILELDTPAEMLGLSAATCGLIRERALRAAHGDVIDELEELDTGIALADRAVRMAREELAAEGGVDLATFDAAAVPFEKSIGPWLKKSVEGGKEVIRVVRWNADKSGGTLAIPTEEELARGVYYDNIEEYRAAHGDAAA